GIEKLYHRLLANVASNLQITGWEWPASAVLSLVTFRRMDFCFKPKRCGSLSVLRRKQIFVPQKVMSALPPKADIYGALADVAVGQKRTSRTADARQTVRTHRTQAKHQVPRGTSFFTESCALYVFRAEWRLPTGYDRKDLRLGQERQTRSIYPSSQGRSFQRPHQTGGLSRPCRTRTFLAFCAYATHNLSLRIFRDARSATRRLLLFQPRSRRPRRGRPGSER